MNLRMIAIVVAGGLAIWSLIQTGNAVVNAVAVLLLCVGLLVGER